MKRFRATCLVDGNFLKYDKPCTLNQSNYAKYKVHTYGNGLFRIQLIQDLGIIACGARRLL